MGKLAKFSQIMEPSFQWEAFFVVTIAGGATEVIAAGNFMDGAITSSTVYLFNHLAHSTSRTARAHRQLKRILKYGQTSGGNMSDVAADIMDNGVRRFIEYAQDPNYGSEFFLNSIDAVQTANSGAPVIGFSLKTASWGHLFFGNNDELRHIIGAFLISEKYGPGEAIAIRSDNEYYGFLRHDIRDWINLLNNEIIFQGHDFAHI